MISNGDMLFEGDGKPIDQEQYRVMETQLFMLVRREAKVGKPAGVVYMVAATERELWKQIEDTEFMGTGMARKALKKDGWKAEKVVIAVPC